MKTSQLFVAALALFCSVGQLLAQAVSPALQAKLDASFTLIEQWAKDPVIVSAVKAHNAAKPADYAGMTQEKWRTLTVLDPLVRSFTRNEVGQFLKTKKSESVSEAFVSDAAGTKVGFLAKTSNWSHGTSPKHKDPMAGKRWTGPIEVDESSGQQQLQIAVPVLDGDTPIGSLVVGLSVTGLSK